MARAHLMKALARRVNGQPLTGATIRVLQPGTTTPIAATIYAGPTGGTTLSNPFVAALPYVDFYLDVPQRVRIGVTPSDGPEVFFEDVDVDRPTESADITPLLPPSTRYGLPSVGAGLPPFAGRAVGDTHFDTTAAREYVLTGAAAFSFSDTFDGTGPLLAPWVDNFGNNSPTQAGGEVSTATLSAHQAKHVVVTGTGTIEASATFRREASGGSSVIGVLFAGASGNFAEGGYRLQIGAGGSELYNPSGQFVSNFGLTLALGETATFTLSVTPAGAFTVTKNGTSFGFALSQVAPGGNRAGFSIFNDAANVQKITAFSVLRVGTLAWTPTATLASLGYVAPTQTRYALNTVGAGLPPFSGRLAGDQHYDSAALKEYVVTGAAAASGTDDFNRANGALGTVNGLTYSYPNGGASPTIVGNRAAGSEYSNGAALLAIGSGYHEVSVKKWIPTDSAFYSHRMRLMAHSTVNLSEFVLAEIAYNAFQGRYELTYHVFNNGASVAVATVNGPTGFDASGLDVSIVSTSSSLTFTLTKQNGVNTVTTIAAVPTEMLTNTNAGFSVVGTLDDFSYLAAGTLTWQQVEPVCLQTIAAGTATVTSNAVKPGLRVPHATTARDLVVRIDTAPTGASYIVTFERWNNGTFANNIGTVTVAAGSSVASTTGLAVALAKGDVIKFNVTQVGSTVAGADVQFNVDCY